MPSSHVGCDKHLRLVSNKVTNSLEDSSRSLKSMTSFIDSPLPTKYYPVYLNLSLPLAKWGKREDFY